MRYRSRFRVRRRGSVGRSRRRRFRAFEPIRQRLGRRR